MKKLIAITAILASTQSFAFIDSAANQNGSAEHQAKSDVKGRGVATFGMNFSASSNVEGDFMHNGMMQNIFGGESEDRPYYYQK
jgi:hypothetical protein